MNELTDKTYQQQMLEERVKERVPTSQGRFREDWVPYQRELHEAMERHRKVVVVGRAGRGKTSLLYWAMLSFLEVLEHDETGVVPIYVPLKELQKVGSLKVCKNISKPRLPTSEFLLGYGDMSRKATSFCCWMRWTKCRVISAWSF